MTRTPDFEASPPPLRARRPSASSRRRRPTQTILNVSYDPTRELYKAYDEAFAAYWKEKTGETVTIEQSHGGSGAQARAVIDGLARRRRHPRPRGRHQQDRRDRQDRQPTGAAACRNNSTPYTSTIVFLVRKGNPKGIKDWGDLVKDGVEVITPNPKTSGGARWNYLAAWAYANAAFGGDEAKNIAFVTSLYKHVPVLDTGARGSTTTFVQREIGDVLLAWENEAFLAVNELGPDKFDIVVPPTSIKAEPPVAVVDGNVDAKGTPQGRRGVSRTTSTATPARSIIARNFYRPVKPGGRRSGGPEALPRAEAGHHRRSAVRRLEGGPAEALRRRRHLRPDLQADPVAGRDERRVATLSLKKPSVIPGFGLALGFTLTYLSLIVLIPLAALVLKTATLGWPEFWRIATDPRTVAALQRQLRHVAVSPPRSTPSSA